MTGPDEATVIHLVSRDKKLSDRFAALAASHERQTKRPCGFHHAGHWGESSAAAAQLIVVDLDTMTDEVLREIPQFRQQGGHGRIVVTYQQPSWERLLKAVRVGANDYVSYWPTGDDFRELLTRTAEHKEEPSAGSGRLITVFSNKGGAGTTTVAINVAASLAAQLSGSVAVVDLVLQHGDISVFLDVPTVYTVVHLISELDRADASYLQSVLPKHSSGVYVAPAPFAPDQGELVTSVQIIRLLQALRASFDAVVVDAGNEFNEQTLAALDTSSHIYLVTLPNLPSVRNTKRSLELFERLGYDSSKVSLIVNRHDAQEPLSHDAIEEALGCRIHWSIPNDYSIASQAINRGAAIRSIQPNGTLAGNIDQLVATNLLGRASVAPVKRRHSPWSLPSLRALLRRPTHGTA